jgi:protein-disulfide isomerase
MHKLLGLCVALLLSIGMARVAAAQTPTCDGLPTDKKQVAQEVMQSQHPYACCEGTIAECVAKQPRCILARRLANDVCRRAGAGQNRATIERALVKRAESMARTGSPVPIDLQTATALGESASKVVIVAYVCARCPFCAKLLPAIERQVTEGALKGKAKLYVRLFPIKTHTHSGEANKAVVAADMLGKFWPFLDKLYAHFDDFDVAKLPDYAVEAGLDRTAFLNQTNDPAVTQRLTDSKKEGLRNKVDATPTIFLNGFKVSVDLSAVLVQDIVEEEHDRLSGRTTE